MDYVYICRSGNNEELRYSIRSILKNLPVSNVWLIGGKPDWYIGNYFYVGSGRQKFDNIVRSIRTIPNVKEISEDFVLMDDDFFVIEKMKEIPTYHGGLLSEKIKEKILINGRTDQYTRLLLRTLKDLQKTGIKEPLNYDLHMPMKMNKTILRDVMDKGYFPKTTYGNLADVGGSYVTDVKVYSRPGQSSYDYLNGNSPFISTIDQSFKNVYNNVLKYMFQEPSPYESRV